MSKRCYKYLLLLALAVVSVASREMAFAESPAAGPHIVMIIRHAEKTGSKTDINLSAKGYQRADALATAIPAHFPKPDYLVAAKQSKHSNRSIETITPLGKALHEEVEAKFKDKEYGQLAHELLTNPKFAGKTVLIAWHHGNIPELAAALGVKNAPKEWGDEVFDRVWEITYDKGAATYQDLPENALPGDSDKVEAK